MRHPFDRVVREHGLAVLRFCRSMHADPRDAEDAYAETFLRAIRAYASLPADANVQAWLVRIAHNASVDIHRRNSVLPVPADDEDLAASVEHASVRNGLRDEAHHGDVDVVELLGLLTERQRSVIAHHYLLGMPFRAIAEELGGTESAARRAAADGIAALRRHVGERAGGETA
ncbi:sigma-70 family RNA polymerase sigma factor [Brevibacterium samyangense]|uniref:Sigma-70 family RNA polymerase sigma factor n=1 Tax=Brevibacterium samyangense TaxID=366888 RepID=A0ABN2TFF0_9MICO